MELDKFARGAEWRKWDLHVHTPKSICHGFGEDNNDTWGRYINALEQLSKNYAVLGINDYLFIDGYERLKKEQNENSRLKDIKLLPVLEFRIDIFAGVQFGKLKRINLHVIFSDEVPIDTIKSQFLNALEASYVLEADGNSWDGSINRASLIELGRKIKSGIPEAEIGNYGTDIKEGFNNLNVSSKEIFKLLKRNCFKNKYLVAVGKTEWADLKWSESSIATKKDIINKADIVFTAAESVEAFNKSKIQLKTQQVNDLLLDCSDAHCWSESQNKDRLGNCFTWIKADPTFDGLRQVLNEPDERIFVGDEPELFARRTNHRTKYINELTIKSLPDYTGEHGVWFEELTIPFNSELVAIIGNKGSGKSAVADIISLCSNYHNDKDFSFLTSKKFRDKRGKIAQNFEATLKWESDNTFVKNLNDSPDDTEVLSVKYLPQGQFERLTNEISTVEEFQKEIESVVFSHIPESERLNTKSFDELIEVKSSVIGAQMEPLRKQVETINNVIIELEKRSTISYKTEIENKSKKKQEELEALEEPKEVSDPNKDPEKKKQSEKLNKKITDIKDIINTIETKIEKAEKQKKSNLLDIEKLKSMKAEIIQKFKDIELFVAEKKKEFADFKIDFDKLISIKTDLTEVDALQARKESQLIEVRTLLGEIACDENSISLKAQLEQNVEALKSETAKLNNEQKLYQKYLEARKIWEKERAKIIGNSETLDTLSFYKSELDYLNDKLQDDLEIKYAERRKIVVKIFKLKQEVIAVYKEARKCLNEIIEENSDTLKNYKIFVDACLVLKADFISDFLGNILQNKMGTFYSKDGGEAQLKSILAEIDFDNVDDVISFLDEIIEAFNTDKRPEQNNTSRNVFDQVKDISSLYYYLFSLEFLENNYQLKQGDKELQQLSPGERGALLLVFYLLLDKHDVPLIIDQPEDNLDNHSVATVLVPFIRAAKKKRQIIMVTHNPNLAVVADAEQIIHVNLDKENNYTFSQTSGSIENIKINGKIVEVLEGAMPAFNARKNKYYE